MTHDRPAWLAEALSSVLDGECEDVEVIVTNNGDHEHTRRLQAKVDDPRVRWFEQAHTVDMLGNLLAGLAQVRGEYVAILHDDDRWSPRFLTVLVGALQRHPEAVMAFSDYHIMDVHGRLDVDATETTTRKYRRHELREGLIHGFFHVAACQSVKITACVWRRAALPVGELTVAPHLDVWLPYLLARGGGAAYFSPERLMSCRIHSGCDATSRDPALWLAAIQCEQRMLDDPNLKAHADLLSWRVALYHRLAGECLLRLGRRRTARLHLRAALRLRPSLRALAGWAASWLVPASVLARL